MTLELMLTLVWRAALIEPHLEYGQCVCQKTADWHLFVRRGQGRGGLLPFLSSAAFLLMSYLRIVVIGIVVFTVYQYVYIHTVHINVYIYKYTLYIYIYSMCTIEALNGMLCACVMAYCDCRFRENEEMT